ncbi:MAG: hypothetical protein NVS4B5_01470 [Vulcanimicrobiaceae bacterium]
MPASSKRPLAIAAIVAVALLVRLALIPLEGYRDDVAVFASWARELAEHGPGAIYGPGVVPPVDYAPGYLYVLWLVGLVRAAIDPQYTHLWMFRVLLKIPNVVADLEAAVLGYAIVRRFATDDRAIAVLAVLLVGPVFWLDSAFWGQADTIATALVFAAILARLRNASTLSWLLLATAILVKPQGAVLIPVFLVRDLMRGANFASFVRAAVAVFVVSYAVTLPFTTQRSPVGVVAFLIGRYVNGVSKAAHGSEGAFNAYTIVGGFFQSDSLRVAGLPLHVWSLALLTLALATIAALLVRVMRGSFDERAIDRAFVYASALALAALFFLGTRMHERYLLPGLACASLVAFDRIDVGLAVAALTVSFAVNCAIIIAGFTGGSHHPQVVTVGHAFSAVNLVALAVVSRAYVMQRSARPA